MATILLKLSVCFQMLENDAGKQEKEDAGKEMEDDAGKEVDSPDSDICSPVSTDEVLSSNTADC